MGLDALELRPLCGGGLLVREPLPTREQASWTVVSDERPTAEELRLCLRSLLRSHGARSEHEKENKDETEGLALALQRSVRAAGVGVRAAAL